MVPTTDKDLGAQRTSDNINLQMDFYRPILEHADAESYLAQADYNLDQARLAVATDRWQLVDQSLFKDYMRAAEEDPFQAYKLYQADETFYERLCAVTTLDVTTARWFQGEVVKKFGVDFRYDLNRCVDWHCAWDEGQPIFHDSDTEVDLDLPTKAAKLFTEGFRSVTGATTKVAVQYGNRFGYVGLNEAADTYWYEQAGKAKVTSRAQKEEAEDKSKVSRNDGEEKGQTQDATARTEYLPTSGSRTVLDDFRVFKRELEVDRERIALLDLGADRNELDDDRAGANAEPDEAQEEGNLRSEDSDHEGEGLVFINDKADDLVAQETRAEGSAPRFHDLQEAEEAPDDEQAKQSCCAL